MSIKTRLQRAENTPRAQSKPRLIVFDHPLIEGAYLAGGRTYDAAGIEALRQGFDLLFIDYAVPFMGFGGDDDELPPLSGAEGLSKEN